MIPHFFDTEWVNAYTDGSQKDGVSGAAVHFLANEFADIVATVPPKPINDRSAGLETNNRAELWAALQALRRGSLVKLALHVDSQCDGTCAHELASHAFPLHCGVKKKSAS